VKPWENEPFLAGPDRDPDIGDVPPDTNISLIPSPPEPPEPEIVDEDDPDEE
jgi:hypothetical protein